MSNRELEIKINQILSKMNTQIIDEVLADEINDAKKCSTDKLRTNASEILEILSYPIVKAISETNNQSKILEFLNTIVEETSQIYCKKEKNRVKKFMDGEKRNSRHDVCEFE